MNPAPIEDDLDDLPAERDSKGGKGFLTFGGSLVANIIIWTSLALVTSQVLRITDSRPVLASRVDIKNRNTPKPPEQKFKPKDTAKVHQKAKSSAAKNPSSAPRLVTSGTETSNGDSENTAEPGTGQPGVLPTGPKPTPPTPPKDDHNTTAPTPPTPPQPPPDTTKPKDEVKPKPPEPPKPRGITADAVALEKAEPDIPDTLKNDSFKGFSRVKVSIAADGLATVSLDESSGNGDFDKLALATVKRWVWKPALKEGEPVPSVQFVRINFEID